MPSPGYLPSPGREPLSPALQVNSLPPEHQVSPYIAVADVYMNSPRAGLQFSSPEAHRQVIHNFSFQEEVAKQPEDGIIPVLHCCIRNSVWCFRNVEQFPRTQSVHLGREKRHVSWMPQCVPPGRRGEAGEPFGPCSNQAGLQRAARKLRSSGPARRALARFLRPIPARAARGGKKGSERL